jgi:preprotein translocase subunit Sec61beta
MKRWLLESVLNGIGETIVQAPALITSFTELYTDESPGLKVDPVVVMVLSIGFIISVVALHGTLNSWLTCQTHLFSVTSP